jgi:hypothetical protein
VLIFLKFVGIANAALWLGTLVFFLCAVRPAFSSEDMSRILPLSHSGAAALILLSRFYFIQCWFGVIALAHLLADWLYAGRPLRQAHVYLLSALLLFSLAGAYWAQPKLRGLHLEMHGRLSTPQQIERAGRSVGFWRGFSLSLNVITLAGIGFYFWGLSNQPMPLRFASANKFRG